MSDRIAVMNVGRVEQIGTPREIYDHPASVFVAGFIGQANLWPVPIVERNGRPTHRRGRRADGSSRCERRPPAGVGETRHLHGPTRADAPSTPTPPDPGVASVHATVTDLVFQGPVVRYELRLPDGHSRRSPTSRPGATGCRSRATPCPASWPHDASSSSACPDGSPRRPTARSTWSRPRRPRSSTSPSHVLTHRPGGSMSDRPRDPELEQAIRFARQMSRRRFMVRGGVGLGGLLLAPSLLAACGDDDSGGDGAEGGDGDKELTFSNWDAYIDEDDNGNVDGAGHDDRRLREGHRHQDDLPQGLQRQRRVLQHDRTHRCSARGSRSPRTSPRRAPGWPPASSGSAGPRSSRSTRIPNHKNLEDAYLDLDVGPGRQALHAVAGGHQRHRLEPGADRAVS